MKKGDVFYTARRAGLILYVLAFTIMLVATIILTVVDIGGSGTGAVIEAGLTSYYSSTEYNYLSVGFIAALVAGILTGYLLLQLIYYAVLHALNKKPGTLSSGSSVVAILFFPLFGFPRLFYTRLERSDKRRTSAKHIAPIREAFGNFENLNKELDRLVGRRSEQASLWYSSTSCIDTSTGQMQSVITKLEKASKDFMDVYVQRVQFIVLEDSKEVKRMQEAVINTKVKMYKARDMELFFEKHVDAVKVYNTVLGQDNLTVHANGTPRGIPNQNPNNAFNNQNGNPNNGFNNNQNTNGNNNFNGNNNNAFNQNNQQMNNNNNQTGFGGQNNFNN